MEGIVVVEPEGEDKPSILEFGVAGLSDISPLVRAVLCGLNPPGDEQ